jgi:1,4-alpha-glucan branching enzyme
MVICSHRNKKLHYLWVQIWPVKQWNFESSLDCYWNLTCIQRCITLQDLNTLYKNNLLWLRKQFSQKVLTDSADRKIRFYTFMRNQRKNLIVVCFNMTHSHQNYRIGLPTKVKLTQIFSSVEYGSGQQFKTVKSKELVEWLVAGTPAKIVLLPPLEYTF